MSETEWPTLYVPSKQNDKITLYPIPSVARADELTIHAAFVPHMDAERIDSVLYENYKEALVWGALAKLQGMAGREWYDPNAAAKHEYLFQHELGKAKAAQNKDNSVEDTRVQMSPFA